MPDGEVSVNDTYADVVLGDRPGLVCVAFGREPYRNAKDKYQHHSWSETRFEWPAERDKLARAIAQEIATGDPVDIYVCPAVRGSWAKARRKGDALPPRVCWVDLDGDPRDPELFDRLGAFVVASGQPGHRHVYVPLDAPIDLGTHAALNKALAARLGGDAKWSDESLLRLPGTWNWKPTVPAEGEAAGEAVLVTVETAAAKAWAAVDLIAELDVTASAPALATGAFGAAGGFTVVGEAPPEPLPNLVSWALGYPDTDRSRAHARLVGACLDAHLTLGQTLSVVAGYRPSVEKYGTRVADEITRFWLKAIDERQRRANTQVARPAAPATGASVAGMIRTVLRADGDERDQLLRWAARKLREQVTAGHLTEDTAQALLQQMQRPRGPAQDGGACA
jgi:hypothetical protein